MDPALGVWWLAGLGGLVVVGLVMEDDVAMHRGGALEPITRGKGLLALGP
jgi:hypothetical protein